LTRRRAGGPFESNDDWEQNEFEPVTFNQPSDSLTIAPQLSVPGKTRKSDKSRIDGPRV